MNDILNDELNAAFVGGQKQYKGELLAPYTEGSRLLFLQVREETDSPFFFVWSFLYLHIQIAKNRKEAIRLAWDKNLFREKVMEWVDNKTQQDREEATSLVAGIIEESQRGRAEAIGDGNSNSGNS